jgi:hypothetical protein
VVLAVFSGHDVGDLGEAPFAELAADVARGGLQLFVDARGTAPSIDVSQRWSSWLQAHAARIDGVHILSSSRLVRFTADFVARAAELGERLRVYDDPVSFENAMTHLTRAHASTMRA